MCRDDKVKNKDVMHTCIHKSLDQRSWLDDFFVSKDLYDNVHVCEIIDSGVNLRDHLPTCCELIVIPKSNDIINDHPSEQPTRAYKER